MTDTKKTYALPEAFTLIDTTALPEINATLIQAKHNITGARFVHIDADDSNNLFAVAFKTPPSDSTGVAHILEHTALCGSKNYPVRDPFFTMLKRSLNTFMNAFTASDWTCYPFSSQNHKDFYNLLGIYLDAAFFPLLRERDFTQEGHRLEFQSADDATTDLTFKGVVFNEMKGAMADPASLLSRRTTRHLYPTTCYHHNSGGEPEDIPNLTWQQLRDFHAEFYHPTNACFFSYGNFPFTDHLTIIEKQVLSQFQARVVNSEVAEEKRLTAPIKVSESFPIDAGESLAGKSMVHVSWLTSDISDSFQNLALTLLSQLLLGNPAAPLYKALLDSGLGSNLSPGCGFHDDYRTTCFAVGLQGTDSDKTDEIEKLILNTLQQISEQGFTSERIEAAIHRLELSNREVGGDSYPYAISLMFRILGPWLHCNDPISALQLDDNLNLLREKLAEGPFFENLIKTWLLNNSHRVTLSLTPDPELAAQMEKLEVQRLLTIQETLSDADKNKIITQAKQLQDSQEGHEDLDCLPTLTMADIDPVEPQTTSKSIHLAGKPVQLYPQPTNGLSYINLAFSCDHIDDTLRPYLPLFCSVLTQVGTDKLSYLEMAQRIEAGTGGIRANIDILDNLDDLDQFAPIMRLRGKALNRNIDQLSEILAQLCSEADFTDQDRLATVIGQIQSSWQNAIPGSGHSYAARAAAGYLTPASKQREQWSGFSQYKLIKKVAELKVGELDEIVAIMQKIAETIIDRRNLLVAVTAEESQFEKNEAVISTLISQVPQQTAETIKSTPKAVIPKKIQLGWTTSIPVSYVTQAFRTTPFNHVDTAPLKVLAALLKANYLHREIREKGGAYGGMATSNSESGIFALMSYRDPQLERTLTVYEQSIDWLLKGDFDDEKIKEAVLSVFSAYDRPLSPSGRGSNEFANYQQGLSHAMRQQYRDRLLAVTKEQLLDVAKRHLSDKLNQSPVSILSNEETLTGAKSNLTTLHIERL